MRVRDEPGGGGGGTMTGTGTRTGPIGGWSRGGGWDGSTGSSASNQLLPVVNVHNINTQCGLHVEYNVHLLERPLSFCCMVK